MFPKIKRKDWSILQTDCPQCLKALNNYYHLTLGSLYTVTQRHWPYRQTKLQTIFLSWCSILSVQFSHAQHFESPWTADQQASLSITNSQSLVKLMCTKSEMPSNHLILCRPCLLLLCLSQHQSLFQWVISWHQVAKVLEFQHQHQSFQWMFRTDFL